VETLESKAEETRRGLMFGRAKNAEAQGAWLFGGYWIFFIFLILILLFFI
jgi:hypothetical protein